MRTPALGIALLLILAGCNGVTTSNPSPKPQDGESNTGPATVEVTDDGSHLKAVNATEVWMRVGQYTDIQYAAAPTVVVRSFSEKGILHATPFERSFGLNNASYVARGALGYFDESQNQVVLLRSPKTNVSEAESTLAHEFVHAMQAPLNASYPENVSEFTKTAVSEGTAVLIEFKYVNAQLDQNRTIADYRRLPDGTPLERLVAAPYHFGTRYAVEYGNASAPVRSVYETPPTTAEQVLHNLPPASEAPKSLEVHGKSRGGWRWDNESVQRRGEANLRFLLEAGLSRKQAANAAAGWGNDQWMRFTGGTTARNGYAWVIRWDSPRDATEFVSRFGDFDANVSKPLQLVRVDNETTVIFSGDAAFVSNASASGTAGNVTVAA